MQKCDPRAIARCPDNKKCGDHVFADGSYCEKFNNQVCNRVCNKPPTHADRIRAMSDEEHAHFLVHVVSDGCPPDMDWNCRKDEDGWDACDKCWAKWLRQPAKGKEKPEHPLRQP